MTIEESTGLPLNACEYNYNSANQYTAAFKRIGGVVYGRGREILSNSDTGWVIVADNWICPNCPTIKQHSVNIFGLRTYGDTYWGCLAYVP